MSTYIESFDFTDDIFRNYKYPKSLEELTQEYLYNSFEIIKDGILDRYKNNLITSDFIPVFYRYFSVENFYRAVYFNYLIKTHCERNKLWDLINTDFIGLSELDNNQIEEVIKLKNLVYTTDELVKFFGKLYIHGHRADKLSVYYRQLELNFVVYDMDLKKKQTVTLNFVY